MASFIIFALSQQQSKTAVIKHANVEQVMNILWAKNPPASGCLNYSICMQPSKSNIVSYTAPLNVNTEIKQLLILIVKEHTSITT